MVGIKELKNPLKFAQQPGIPAFTTIVCAERRGHSRPPLEGLEEIVPVATVLHQPQPEMCINPKICLILIEVLCNLVGLEYYKLVLYKDM